MYERILVGTDGSKTAAKAVDRAVEVAADTGAAHDLLRGQPAKGEAIVAAEQKRHAGTGVAIDVKVVDADAASALVDEARRELRPPRDGEQGHDRPQPLLHVVGPRQGQPPPPLQLAHRQDHVRRLGAVLLLAVVVGACRLQLDVNVEVAEDGSGTVEVVVGVDRDGIERIGGDLGAVLAIDDLEAAGWRIEGPDEEADGFTRVRFRKAFDDPEEASAIFEEIAGEDGPFQDFAVSHDPSFARTEWGFSGRVDFSGGLEAFGDDELAAELDGEPLGQTVEEIEAQLGEALSRIIQVRVGVRLPGEVTSNATTKAENGALWQVALRRGYRRHGGERRGDAHRHASWGSSWRSGAPCCCCSTGWFALAMRSSANQRERDAGVGGDADRHRLLVEHHPVGVVGGDVARRHALRAGAEERHRARHLLEDVGPVLGAHHRGGHLERLVGVRAASPAVASANAAASGSFTVTG